MRDFAATSQGRRHHQLAGIHMATCCLRRFRSSLCRRADAADLFMRLGQFTETSRRPQRRPHQLAAGTATISIELNAALLLPSERVIVTAATRCRRPCIASLARHLPFVAHEDWGWVLPAVVVTTSSVTSHVRVWRPERQDHQPEALQSLDGSRDVLKIEEQLEHPLGCPISGSLVRRKSYASSPV